MLFRMLNMFCTFNLVHSKVCVQWPIWLFFCNSLTSRFPGVLLRNCHNDCGMVPVAPVITGITLLLYATCAEFLL